MTNKNIKPRAEAIKSIMEQNEECLRPLVQMVVQKILESAMAEH
jgi:hypothetical protein